MYHSVLNSNNYYRCNNCNLEALLEELRVLAPSVGPKRGGQQLAYPNRHLQPELYLEMLLCHNCLREYRIWQTNPRLGSKPSGQWRNRPDCFPFIPLENWFRKQLRENRILATPRSVSIPWWQVPPSPTARQTFPAA